MSAVPSKNLKLPVPTFSKSLHCLCYTKEMMTEHNLKNSMQQPVKKLSSVVLGWS